MSQGNISCTKIVRFSSGHRVLYHETKCKFLHGHNYKAEITARATTLDTVGRIVDFSVIKAELGKWIDDNWDHKTLLFTADIQMKKAIDRHHIWLCHFNPTAENMAQFLVQKGNELMEKSKYDVEISEVKLWETETCFAIARK